LVLFFKKEPLASYNYPGDQHAKIELRAPPYTLYGSRREAKMTASRLLPYLACVAFAAAAHAQTAGPAITIDGAASRHPISDDIYGMAEYGVDPAFQAAARLPVLRWGGDGTTRYNWQVDSSNAGFDWYFMGGSGNANPTPSGGPDALVLADQATHSQTLLTIPIIPYIDSTAATNCSYPTSVYGAQFAVNPYVTLPDGSQCGDSLEPDGTTQIADTNILANHIANTPSIQQAWVRHLVGRFGTAKAGGVQFYQMDNEPFGWANTHRDVQPAQPTYDFILSQTQAYAAAVKHADKTALVLGPSDFGWPAYVGNQAEIQEHGGLWNAPWYLQQMAAYQAAHHVRLIDYFDEHYYPNYNTAPDDALILQSTRSLWDPSYTDPSWIGQYYGAIMLIPRMRAWVGQYAPGLKVAISEYSWGNGGSLVGALAQADVLGIFGRESLDFATMWNVPKPTDPVAFSFLLYRNYDGAGNGFGTQSILSSSADQDQVAVYAARRSDHTLTIVLINKTPGDLTTPVTIQHPSPDGPAQMYGYGAANLGAIVQGAPVLFTRGQASIVVPAMSMNMVVIK
jgi:hypothetical protein